MFHPDPATECSILIPLVSSQHNLYDIYLLLCVQCSILILLASSRHNLYDIYLLLYVQC